MVESKHSPYDSIDPPLVPAVSAPYEADMMIETVAIDEHHHLDPVASTPMATVMGSDDNDIPLMSESSTSSTSSLPDEEQGRSQERMIGAGVACGVLGLLFGGPIIGAIIGFGAAYCTQKEDAAGDVARALGDVALSAKDKAKEINSKHHLVEKSSKVASNAWEKAKEMDRQHEVLSKVSTAFTVSIATTVDFARRYRLVERSMDAVGSSMYYVFDKLAATVATAPPAIQKDAMASPLPSGAPTPPYAAITGESSNENAHNEV